MDRRNVRRSFPGPRDGVRRLPMIIEEDDADVDLGIHYVVHLHSGEAENRLIGPVERELDPFSQAADQLPQLREVTDHADADVDAAGRVNVIGRKLIVSRAHPSRYRAG